MSNLSIDHIIVYGFLMIVLLVGLFAGRKIKDMRDYSLANNNYGTGVILLTLLATGIGGGSSSGLIASVYKDGIIAIGMFLAISISILLTAIFLIPKMKSFTIDELSMADIIGKAYGQNARFITGVLGFIYSTALVGIQVLALGTISEYLLGMNKLYGILISGGILVIYTAFGGIRSVAITDILEFFLLIIIIPIVAILAVKKAGGMKFLVNNIPQRKMDIIHHKRFIYYALLFIMHLVPSYCLDPT